MEAVMEAVCGDCKKPFLPCASSARVPDFCQRCIDVRELRKNPRPNFQPDARVVPEECYIFPPRKKQVLNPTLSADHWLTPTVVKTTLLELALQKNWPAFATDILSKKNPQPHNGRVYLDEADNKHDYYVKFRGDVFEKDNILSTSSMYKPYFAPYDKYDAVSKMLRGQQWGPKHKDWGHFYTTDEQVLVANLKKIMLHWTIKGHNSCAIGKFVHYLIECDMNGSLDLSTNVLFLHLPRVQMYLRWKAKHFTDQYDAFLTEFALCTNDTYRMTGTWDFACVAKNHGTPQQTGGVLHVHLRDWKNAVIDLMPSFSDKGKGVCSHLADMDLVKYSIQQCNYEKMAKQKDVYASWYYQGHVYNDIQFDSKSLVCFDDTNPNGEAILRDIVDLHAEVDAMWDERKQDVLRWEEQKRPTIPKHVVPELGEEEKTLLLQSLVRKSHVFLQVTHDCTHRLVTIKSPTMLFRVETLEPHLRTGYLHRKFKDCSQPIVLSHTNFGEKGRETRNVYLQLLDLTKLGIAPDSYCECHYFDVLFGQCTEPWTQSVPDGARLLRVHVPGTECSV